jgi:hypothetical protein
MAGPQTGSTPLIYPNMVYIDPINGVSLTTAIITTVIGTPDEPVNNLGDAIKIAALRNTNNFHVKNVLFLDRNLPQPYNFFGDGDITISGVNFNFFDATNSIFHGLATLGASPGFIYGYNCFVSGTLTDISPGQFVGKFWDCLVGSIIAIPGSNQIACFNCNPVGNPYYQSTFGGGYIFWAGGSGALSIHLSNNALSLFIVMATDCTVLVSSDCTAGVVTIDEASKVYNFVTNPAMTVNDYVTYAKARTAIFTKVITSAANAGDVLAFTASQGRVKINSIIERSNGATTGDLTTAAVYCETAKAVTLISTLLATQAALNAIGKQVQGVGPWTLESGHTGIISLLGTGATPVNLTLDIEFEATVDGAHLV